jgi:hypothetical protein
VLLREQEKEGSLSQTAVGTIVDPHRKYSEQVCVKSFFIIGSDPEDGRRERQGKEERDMRE